MNDAVLIVAVMAVFTFYWGGVWWLWHIHPASIREHEERARMSGSLADQGARVRHVIDAGEGVEVHVCAPRDMSTETRAAFVAIGRAAASMTTHETRRCRACGAVLDTDQQHKHENRNWKPRYDDFEGALEGYEVDEQRQSNV